MGKQRSKNNNRQGKWIDLPLVVHTPEGHNPQQQPKKRKRKRGRASAEDINIIATEVFGSKFYRGSNDETSSE